ncbi:MAG: hypothetical protein JWN38_1263 [Candidatus Saccharibacteria bacterium]|nr:hypothetical protein [Candidatus Saccharibacteria bacterium]
MTVDHHRSKFTHDKFSVNFFGFTGYKTPGGLRFTGVLDNEARMAVRVQNNTIFDRIRTCIKEDRNKGISKQIAMVYISAEHAVVLWLNGELSDELLGQATHGFDHAEIPGFPIDDDTFTLRIMANPAQPIATANQYGQYL